MTYLNFKLFNKSTLQSLLPTEHLKKIFSDIIIFPSSINFLSEIFFLLYNLTYYSILFILFIPHLDKISSQFGSVFYFLNAELISERDKFFNYFARLSIAVIATFIFKISNNLTIRIIYVVLFLLFVFISSRVSYLQFIFILVAIDILNIISDGYNDFKIVYSNEKRIYQQNIILDGNIYSQINHDKFIEPIRKFFNINNFKNIYLGNNYDKTYASSGISTDKGYIICKKSYLKNKYKQSILSHEYAHIKYSHSFKNAHQKFLLKITSFFMVIIISSLVVINEKNSHLKNIIFYFYYFTLFAIFTAWVTYISNSISFYFEIQADLIYRSRDLILLDIERYLRYLQKKEKLKHLFIDNFFVCFIQYHPTHLYRIEKLIELYNKIKF